MVQWGDYTAEARIDVNMTFLLLGIYGWEYLQSLGVEHAVIRRRLNFRWPLIPYLVGRTTCVIALIMLTFEKTVAQASFACQPTTMSSAGLGFIAQACSSANLMIRTWLMWKNSRLVHVLLLLAALGQGVMMALSIAQIRVLRVNGICIIHLVQPGLTAGDITYTMCYDLLVLVLAIVKLSRQPSKSHLSERLRSQGILYFAVAAMANVPPMVFFSLRIDLPATIAGHCAMTASVLVSSRAVRSLLDFRTTQSSSHMPDDESIEHNEMLTTGISVIQASAGPANV